MKTTKRDSGLWIKAPAGYTVADIPTIPEPARRATRGRVFGPTPMPPEQALASDDAVVSALEGQDMELVDQFQLGESKTASSTRRGTSNASQGDSIEFALPVAPHEDAVVLLAQDGLYSWQFPSESRTQELPSGRRGVPVSPRRLIRFKISISHEEAPTRRTGRRGILEDLVVKHVKAYVFKFAARVAVGQVMKYLERNVGHGIVSMSNADDPTRWEKEIALDSLQFPQDRPARILLFIHGTFSSTVGAYGPLTAMPWGQEFLRAAQANYDAVIGFDHYTLSEDPLENATDLLNALQSVPWKFPPRFDVITHSRGGLVIRSLLEQLMPISDFQVRFERVIFVAVTNAGTPLAEPDNWRAMIDLYTNISLAVCRLIGMYPQAKAPTLVLKEILSGLSALIKYCTTTAISERSVPGLAAMEPDGEFISKLNEVQENQPTVEQSYYCAVISEFEPRLFDGEHEPKEFPRRLVLWIADVFAKKLLKASNDLAVDTASMTSIDAQVGNYIKDTLDFGRNPQVYHTNYFVRPEVTNALVRWLRLVQPASDAPKGTSGQPTTRGKKRGAGKTTGLDVLPWHLDSVVLGGMVTPDVPAAVDTDILITNASIPWREAVEEIRGTRPSFVVVRRNYQGETLDYAFAAEEILGRGSQPAHTPLLDVLNLHEADRSDVRPIGSSLEPRAGREQSLTAGRAVMTMNNRPIGVLPERADLLGGDALVALANLAARPRTDEELILARRAMPSFSTPVEHVAVSMRGTTRAFPSTRVTRSGSSRAQEKPAEITCHFRAEMDEKLLVKRPTTVDVLISRESIGLPETAAAAESTAEIDPGRKLLIQVLPKINFEILDEGWTEIDPPRPGAPQQLYFLVKPTYAGDGELWIVVRQGQIPLVTLVLKPEIVKAKPENRHRTSATATTGEAPRLESALHQLFITECRNGDEVSYRLQLQAPDLKVFKWAFSEPLRADVQQYVANLHQEIENRWLGNQDDVANFVEELRAMGANMLDELVPRDVQEALWEHRDRIKSIMVISEEPFIPWELVHLKQPGKPLGKEVRFLGQMGLVRWLQEAGWPQDHLKIRKNKARYVIPHYPHPDYELPEAEKEYKFLEKNFGATAVVPKSGDVRKLVSQPGTFDLLHFACHGIAEQDNVANAQLLLEGRVEGTNYIPDYFSATTAEQHANLAENGSGPLIVLNACQAGRAGYKLTGVGGFARAFLRRGAGAFVSTLWSVGDSPARGFTEEFYSQLLQGKTIAAATIKARETARVAGDATWLAYVVYGHPHATLLP